MTFRIIKTKISKDEVQWSLSTDVEDYWNCDNCERKLLPGQYAYYCKDLDKTFCEECEFEKYRSFECNRGITEKQIITTSGNHFNRALKTEGHSHVKVKMEKL